MICEHCGKNNHNSATVCRSCGEKLHRSEVRIPLRYGRTHRPGMDSEEPPQEAASPNEYFFDPTDYGDQTAYAGQRKAPVPEPDPQEAPPVYPQQPYPQQPYFQQPYPQQSYQQPYPQQPYPQPYPPMAAEAPVRRKSRVPYLIVSHLTAALAVLCFVFPLWEWVSYHFQLLDWSVLDGRLSLLELAKKLYEDNSIVRFVTGADNEMIQSMVPNGINAAYTQARLAGLAVAIVFLIALVLFFLFILMVLFRQRRVAAGFGITAALLYGGSCIGVMYAVNILNGIVLEYDNVSWNIIQFKLLNIPYAGLGVAALILVLCIVFAALGAGTDRRRR